MSTNLQHMDYQPSPVPAVGGSQPDSSRRCYDCGSKQDVVMVEGEFVPTCRLCYTTCRVCDLRYTKALPILNGKRICGDCIPACAMCAQKHTMLLDDGRCEDCQTSEAALGLRQAGAAAARDQGRYNHKATNKVQELVHRLLDKNLCHETLGSAKLK